MQIKLFTIPNCITLCNLLCGAAATVMALGQHNLEVAFWLLVAAAVCDFLDGFTARLLNSYSGIGVELDSLADMVSFGLAPAAILFSLYQQAEPHWAEWSVVAEWGGYALFLVTAFSALRLAKFNVDEEQHTEFKGLPTPACALFCASLGWLVARGNLQLGQEMILLLDWALALLLIAPVRMFSFKFEGFGWRKNALRYLFALLTLALLIGLGVGAVPVVILLYILTSIARNLLTKGCRKS